VDLHDWEKRVVTLLTCRPTLAFAIQLRKIMENLSKGISFSWSRSFPPFMEPEGSMPCSQEAATVTYPEPDETSPYPIFLFAF
jgi:hypothetical protein